MLKKRNRLRLRQEKNFFSQAERLSGSGYTLLIRKQTHAEPQIACLTPKKFTPLASHRHRLNRQALASCEILLKEHALAPFEYVLIVHNSFLSQDKKLVLQELQDRGNKLYSSPGK
ncbi:MAG: hypothetical protein A3A82_00270 [Candidatus Pacebacteria bacterium RIFCSPLOWO2_01_FULL_47_12]|nr:MAG: hypothetical protein A3J60_03065 [Candidatus Pacebacteria bacterium RIFCSPHIGHO2_02_FULL_46_9]OGJ39226.1 MAG: hypothetical protein A3A82_00270 [Candidatus Pacebacteria bacterium RIFCSPLOWO2_01_FULL_47_12]